MGRVGHCPAALAVLGGCSCPSSQQPRAEVRPSCVLAEGDCGACSGAASLKACLTPARRLGGPPTSSGGGGAERPGGPGSVAASGWVPVPWCGLLLGRVAACHCPSRRQLLAPGSACRGSGTGLSPGLAATLMLARPAPSVPQSWGCLCVVGRQWRGPRACWPWP